MISVFWLQNYAIPLHANVEYDFIFGLVVE